MDNYLEEQIMLALYNSAPLDNSLAREVPLHELLYRLQKVEVPPLACKRPDIVFSSLADLCRDGLVLRHSLVYHLTTSGRRYVAEFVLNRPPQKEMIYQY